MCTFHSKLRTYLDMQKEKCLSISLFFSSLTLFCLGCSDGSLVACKEEEGGYKKIILGLEGNIRKPSGKEAILVKEHT